MQPTFPVTLVWYCMPGTEPATLSSLGGMQPACSSLCNGNCSAVRQKKCTWGSNRLYFGLRIRARTVYSRLLCFWLKIQFFCCRPVSCNYTSAEGINCVPIRFRWTATASQPASQPAKGDSAGDACLHRNPNSNCRRRDKPDTTKWMTLTEMFMCFWIYKMSWYKHMHHMVLMCILFRVCILALNCTAGTAVSLLTTFLKMAIVRRNM